MRSFDVMSFSSRYNILYFHCSKVDSKIVPRSSKKYSGNTTENKLMAYDKYDKPPLIIMHCLFGSKSNWITLARALNKSLSRTVYTIDLRNHGDSPHSDDFNFNVLADDTKYFLDYLSVKKVSIMGHSMGGKAAMYYALKYPDYVEKIISIDMSPFSASKERKYLYQFFDAMKAVQVENSVSAPDGRKIARNQLTKVLKSRLVVDFLLMNFYKSEGEFKWRLNIESLEKNFHDTITAFPEVTKKCEKPVLFLVGSKSDYIVQEDESTIIEWFPLSKFIYLNTGHWVHAEDPKGVIEAVTDFLKF